MKSTQTQQNGNDKIVIDDRDVAETICWIVSKHNRHLQEVLDLDEDGESVFDVSGKAREAMPDGPDDVHFVYETDQELSILSASMKKAIEDGPRLAIDQDDIDIARDIYGELGGDVEAIETGGPER